MEHDRTFNIRCGSNPVYKTRVMAAKAMVPLVSAERTTVILQSLFARMLLLYSQGGKRANNNSLHGTLLQFKHLLNRCLTQSKISTDVNIFSGYVSSLSWIGHDDYISYVTKSLYIDAVTSLQPYTGIIYITHPYLHTRLWQIIFN